MTDKEYTKAVKFILKRAQQWQKKLNLSSWDITFQFTRDSISEKECSNFSVSALCESDWRYLHAVITFCVPVLASKSVVELDKIIVHELVHIFLSETREPDEDLSHEERVASSITSAILKVYMEKE